MEKKLSGGPGSIQIKVILLVLATIIALATFIYTQTLISQLEKREREVAELYATSLQQVAELSSSGKDFTFLLDVIKRIDFPLILTDSNNEVNLNGVSGSIRNLEIDSTLSLDQKVECREWPLDLEFIIAPNKRQKSGTAGNAGSQCVRLDGCLIDPHRQCLNS